MKMKKIFYFWIFLLGIILYCDAAKELLIQRGGFYIGGEILLLGLPLWVWLISEGFSSLFEEVNRK